MAEYEQQSAAGQGREALLDYGYQALRAEDWKQAKEIFRGLLQGDPSCGLSCLGMAMAEKQIGSREELAAVWDRMQEDPEFRKALEPAPKDFRDWLWADMKKATEPEEEELSAFSLYMPDFSLMSTGRKLLLGFAGVQVVLFAAVVRLLMLSLPGTGDFFSKLLGNFIVALLMCGLPVILGPVYGNSIVEAGRFCRFLKIVNTIVCILGGIVCGFMVVVFYASLQISAGDDGLDHYFFYAFIVAFVIHLISLVLPMILDKVEYG